MPCSASNTERQTPQSRNTPRKDAPKRVAANQRRGSSSKPQRRSTARRRSFVARSHKAPAPKEAIARASMVSSRAFTGSFSVSLTSSAAGRRHLGDVGAGGEVRRQGEQGPQAAEQDPRQQEEDNASSHPWLHRYSQGAFSPFVAHARRAPRPAHSLDPSISRDSRLRYWLPTSPNVCKRPCVRERGSKPLPHQALQREPVLYVTGATIARSLLLAQPR